MSDGKCLKINRVLVNAVGAKYYIVDSSSVIEHDNQIEDFNHVPVGIKNWLGR